MRDFRKLIVWERAHFFAINVYKITKQFPKEELYGITSQMRRSVISIPTTLQKEAVDNLQKNFQDFLASPLDQQVRLSI